MFKKYLTSIDEAGWKAPGWINSINARKRSSRGRVWDCSVLITCVEKKYLNNDIVGPVVMQDSGFIWLEPGKIIFTDKKRNRP